ncbi:large ribosomal subunit protein P2-like [Lampetra fluviatilis]
MRYVAAYLLATLGGNEQPTANDIKKILGSVGIEADDSKLSKVINELKGKNVEEVISAGFTKISSVPGGVAVSAGVPGGSAAPDTAGTPAAAAEVKKEEKKEESDESEDDMGFGLFD